MANLNGLRLPLKFIIIYACMHLNALPFIRVQNCPSLAIISEYNSNIYEPDIKSIVILKPLQKHKKIKQILNIIFLNLFDSIEVPYKNIA